MSIELERRKLTGNATDLSTVAEDVRKRSLELSAYFTIPALDASHTTLTWYSAMTLANRNRQFSSALSFANSLIEKGTNPKFKETVSDFTRFTLPTRTNLGTGPKGEVHMRT